MLPRPAVLTGVLGLLTAVVLTLSGGAATATGQSTGQGAKAATYSDVFTGHVTKVTQVPATKRKAHHKKVPASSTYTVQVATIYHGSVHATTVSVHDVARGCPSQSATGEKPADTLFLFRLNRVGGTLTRSSCPEVLVAKGIFISRMVTKYGNGHTPVAPSPNPVLPAVQQHDLDVGSPTPFTRLAAPGLAVVIVALLGLFVVRRLNRVRRA